MLTPQLMNSMDDAHLVAAVECEINPLTSTPLEIELLARLEDKIDGDADYVEIIAAIDEYDFEADDVRALGDAVIRDATNSAALLAVIGDAGIDTPEALQARLKLADQFQSLADDAGDVFTRLAHLTTTQE